MELAAILLRLCAQALLGRVARVVLMRRSEARIIVAGFNGSFLRQFHGAMHRRVKTETVSATSTALVMHSQRNTRSLLQLRHVLVKTMPFSVFRWQSLQWRRTWSAYDSKNEQQAGLEARAARLRARDALTRARRRTTAGSTGRRRSRRADARVDAPGRRPQQKSLK